jgi:transcription elongation factor Elf1
MAKTGDELAHIFECAYCGHEITQRLARRKDDAVIACLRCGNATKFESGGAIREMRDRRDELDRAWLAQN